MDTLPAAAVALEAAVVALTAAASALDPADSACAAASDALKAAAVALPAAASADPLASPALEAAPDALEAAALEEDDGETFWDQAYEIANPDFGARITVRSYLDFDEDGQAYWGHARLTDWKGGTEDA